MGSHQETQRILDWVVEWYGGTEESSPFSREDIRNICRGPMREILLDFFSSRFRTNEQIKVIRSNLFLNNIPLQKDADGQGGTSPANQYDAQIKELKTSLHDIHNEKMMTTQAIDKHVENIEESKRVLEKTVADQIAYFDKSEFHAHILRDRVTSTGILVQDLKYSNQKPSCEISQGSITSKVVTVEADRNEDSSPSTIETTSVRYPQLESLYTNADGLFDLYFFHSSPSSGSGFSENNRSEVQSLTKTVSLQTAELVQSGLSPCILETWAKQQLDRSNIQIKHLRRKFSNVMNPIEEMQNEAEALYVKLMEYHVDLHMKNMELKKKLVKLTEQNKSNINEAVVSDETLRPGDFLFFVKKEEKAAQLAKCRELSKQLRLIEQLRASTEDITLLPLICGNAMNADVVEIKEQEDTLNKSKLRRVSLLPSDGNRRLSFMKKDSIEDITCSLLKSIPLSANQLESTLQQCKSLVLERFPKTLAKDTTTTTENRRMMDMHLGKQTYEQFSDEIKVPKPFIPNYDLLTDTFPTCEQTQDELSEAFRVQKELESKRLRSETILQARLSFVPTTHDL